MSDSSAELLIKIRTALEAGGLDAAKQKLTELTGATTASTAATTEAAAAEAKHAAEANKAAHTLHIVKAAAEGNVGAVIKLTGETNGLAASLTKALPVLASFWAGWESGKGVGDWLWTKFVGGVKDVGEKAIKAKDEFKALNDVKLEKLLEQLDRIEQSLQRSLADLNDIEARTKAEATAVTERQIAAVEASGKTDPEKQKEIAEIKSKAAEKEAETTQTSSKLREGQFRQAKEQTDAEIKKIREDKQASEDNLNRSRERYKTNPESETLMKDYKEARNRAAAAEETYGKKLPGLENKSAALGRQILDEESIQKRAGIGLETAGYQKTAAMTAAEKAEKEIAKKRTDEERQARIEQLNIQLSEEKDPEKARTLLGQRSKLQIGGLGKDLSPEARALSEQNINLAAQKQITDLEKERQKKKLQEEKKIAEEEAQRAQKASDQYDPHKGEVQRNGHWVDAKTGRRSNVTKEQETRDADLSIAATTTKAKVKRIEDALKNLDAVGTAMDNIATSLENLASKVKTIPQGSS